MSTFIKKLKIQDLNIEGKRVLIRLDLNVPINENGEITDETKILEALPTIHYVLKNQGSAILMSHFGRPKGKKNSSFSLAPCQKALSKLLNIQVILAPDCVGKATEEITKSLKRGEVVLLENLRFHDAEEDPSIDKNFAKNLSVHGDLFVNDAFGCCHREHSSISEITKYFPNKSAAGLLLQKEIKAFEKILNDPIKPFYAIIGGSKISTKIGTLKSLISKVQGLFLGGAMCFTILKCQGFDIGSSLIEENELQTAKDFLKQCLEAKIKLFLPKDFIISQDSSSKVIKITKVENGIPLGWKGYDIGPITEDIWAKEIGNAKTIFWNGPLGMFEIKEFAHGTYAIAKSITSNKSCMTIVGGGDSLSAINQAGLSDAFYHLSTGGGASLELIEYGTLPGIESLSSSN